MKPKQVFYTDPLQDEFSGVGKRPPIDIGPQYPYIHTNWFYKIATFVAYRLIMTPVAFLYSKIKFRARIEGREKLKPYRKSGIYLYGNHTQIPGDGYLPNLMTFPKDAYFIVNPDNVAAPGTRTFMTMMGTLPIPTTMAGFGAFEKAIEQRLAQNACVVIYPEAHIWPYCTLIRPFGATSFRYPAKDGRPVFCFTNTYRRSAHGKPRMVTQIDGPFFSDAPTMKQRQAQLHQAVYQAMCNRAENPANYSFIQYIKKEN